MKKAAILTTALLDKIGKDFILGGNERYLMDIINIYEAMDVKCDIYQPSIEEFKKSINTNVVVHGIKFALINHKAYVALNKIFYSKTAEADIHHYQSFTLAYPKCHANSIGICHGISWDKPIGESWDSPYTIDAYMKNRLKNKILLSRYYKASCSLNNIVANDTNFINWARTTWPNLVKKLTYIPNYVDLNEFTPNIQGTQKKDTITILFPRRLSKERGFYIAQKASLSLLQKHEHINFIFTGEEPHGSKEFYGKYYDRVLFKKATFEEMKDIYCISDIAIIPSQYSEGTSLSCLEAMASGIPVITTNIGGLTNLVINELNGLLIATTTDSLINAIDSLIINKDLRTKLAKNGYETAKVFSKEKWRKEWYNLINQKL